MKDLSDITPGSTWRHHSGRKYRVLFLTNVTDKEDVRYPLTVIYENLDLGTKWSRSANDWHRSMTLVED